jgi:hypothetical protein
MHHWPLQTVPEGEFQGTRILRWKSDPCSSLQDPSLTAFHRDNFEKVKVFIETDVMVRMT